jgi:hypothetical protein
MQRLVDDLIPRRSASRQQALCPAAPAQMATCVIEHARCCPPHRRPHRFRPGCLLPRGMPATLTCQLQRIGIQMLTCLLVCRRGKAPCPCRPLGLTLGPHATRLFNPRRRRAHRVLNSPTRTRQHLRRCQGTGARYERCDVGVQCAIVPSQCGRRLPSPGCWRERCIRDFAAAAAGKRQARCIARPWRAHPPLGPSVQRPTPHPGAISLSKRVAGIAAYQQQRPCRPTPKVFQKSRGQKSSAPTAAWLNVGHHQGSLSKPCVTYLFPWPCLRSLRRLALSHRELRPRLKPRCPSRDR